MPEPTTIYDFDGSLGPGDREDITLFLHYPEIGFDSEDVSCACLSTTLVPDARNELACSPVSTIPSTICRDSSLITGSTAQTTPSRILADGEIFEFGGWNEFIHLMQQSDLPQECLQYLTSLGQTILNIGTILHSTLRPNQPSSVVRIGRWLLKSIKYSSEQVQKQVGAIVQMKLLVAFNIKPDESNLWSTYRQRARLIVKYKIASAFLRKS